MRDSSNSLHEDVGAEFRGYGMPRTARGRASAYGQAPWRLCGRVFTIWYHLADPAEGRRQVPPPLEAPENPLCRARFYELNMDAGYGDELVALNPEQSQFFEAVIAIECSYQGIQGDCSVHMYSDNATYIAWGREVIGWPLKQGKITMTRPWKPGALEAGVEIAGELERYGRRLMSARVKLRERQEARSRPLPNWFSHKQIPGIEGDALDVDQLILSGPSRMDVDQVWDASGEFELHEGLADELHHLRPAEIVSADYVPWADLTVGHGRVLKHLK